MRILSTVTGYGTRTPLAADGPKPRCGPPEAGFFGVSFGLRIVPPLR
jgi:hypothetical protein